MALPERRAKDRRVQKTQSLLREALASLVREKDYDSIAVKEILDRANVGRSTFYLHFRDKDELLVSRIHEMLGSVPAPTLAPGVKPYERLIWFSLPFFEYHDRHRHSGEARMGPKGRAILHQHLQKVLAELIAEELRKNPPARRKSATPIPNRLLAHYVASTFVMVLDWWVESKSRTPPKEVNELFRALVLPGLELNWR